MMNLKQISIQVIKNNQATSGAYVASPTFSQYGYSWLRDGTWIATSMDCVGEHASASAFHRWVAATLFRYEARIHTLLAKVDHHIPIAETDFLPTRFTIDGNFGEEDWPDFQLDGYGAWLWGIVEHCQRHNVALWDEVRPAVSLLVRYLAAVWNRPNYDCWEEFRDHIHVATLAVLAGGLAAVEAYDHALVPHGLVARIREFTLESGVSADGHLMKFFGNEQVDASLLWTAIPFRLVEVDDPRFLLTVKKIEQDIHRPGGGVYRYRADTYFGGGEWPLLTCWLAWVYIHLKRTDEARQLLTWVEQQASTTGEMPEQVADHALDSTFYQPWVDRWGTSACPLLWSHAMYLIVVTALEEIEL